MIATISSRSRAYTMEVFEVTAKEEAIELIKRIPDSEISILLEVIRRFVTIDIDDIATAEDIAACEQTMKEYRAGQTVSLEDIDWS